MKSLKQIVKERKNDEMTIAELIKILEKKFDPNMKVYIDTSVDGGFSGERPLIEDDIQTLKKDESIIFIAYY